MASLAPPMPDAPLASSGPASSEAGPEKKSTAVAEKPQASWRLPGVPYLAAGIGLLLLGLAGWAYDRSRYTGVGGMEMHRVTLPANPPRRVASEQDEPENFEDALRSLEMDGDEGLSSGHPLTDFQAKKRSKPKTDEHKDILEDLLKDAETGSSPEERAAHIQKALDRLEKAKGSKDRGFDLEAELEKLRKRRAERVKGKSEEDDEESAGEHDEAHKNFADRLNKEREQKLEYNLTTVKEDFKREFGSSAKGLVCSGCKLVAARFRTEVDTHDVHDQDNPAAMLEAKRRAIDATCGSFRHIQVVQGAHGPRFEAKEANPDEPFAHRMELKLCSALLEEAKFEMLAKMIQSKMPTMMSFYTGAAKKGTNWERWLCAQRTKLCKRSEVKDDDDEEEEL